MNNEERRFWDKVGPTTEGEGEGMIRTFDRGDLEDLSAPHGRCVHCSRPFGMPSKDGFIVYKAYGEGETCTECVYDLERDVGRRHDDNLNMRKSKN